MKDIIEKMNKRIIHLAEQEMAEKSFEAERIDKGEDPYCNCLLSDNYRLRINEIERFKDMLLKYSESSQDVSNAQD